jgi:hypothetical protein
MEDIKHNKWFWILGVVLIFNIGAFVMSKVIVNKAADKVIQKLQKEYSPSPYGPGFDPDKVNPEAFRSNAIPSIKQNNRHGGQGIWNGIQTTAQWRNDWEAERINP